MLYYFFTQWLIKILSPCPSDRRGGGAVLAGSRGSNPCPVRAACRREAVKQSGTWVQAPPSVVAWLGRSTSSVSVPPPCSLLPAPLLLLTLLFPASLSLPLFGLLKLVTYLRLSTLIFFRFLRKVVSNCKISDIHIIYKVRVSCLICFCVSGKTLSSVIS